MRMAVRHYSCVVPYLVATAACATSPLGRKQLMLVPEQQVDALGSEAFAQIKQETPIDLNERDNAFVDCVAHSITSEIQPADYPWKVVVFDTDEINAFALPGGKIGVYKGIFQVAGKQDELATVLAHETAHVIARHGAERVSESLVLQAGVEAVSAVMSNPQQRTIAMAALGLGSQVGVVLPHSRTQEREADSIGLELMATGGFDPRAAIALWRNMEQRAPQGSPEFLSDHPSHPNRIKDLESQLPAALKIYERAQNMGKRPQCAPRGQP